MAGTCKTCGGLIPAANEVLGYSGPICSGQHYQRPPEALLDPKPDQPKSEQLKELLDNNQLRYTEADLRQREAEARIDELERLLNTQDLHVAALVLFIHADDCPLIEGVKGYADERIAQLKQEQK